MRLCKTWASQVNFAGSRRARPFGRARATGSRPASGLAHQTRALSRLISRAGWRARVGRGEQMREFMATPIGWARRARGTMNYCFHACLCAVVGLVYPSLAFIQGWPSSLGPAHHSGGRAAGRPVGSGPGARTADRCEPDRLNKSQAEQWADAFHSAPLAVG